MSRSLGLAHVIRNPDRTATGRWGAFELKSAFQPIFAFRGGKLRVAGFEGLARPFHGGAPVPPGAFLGFVPAPERPHVETLLRALHLLNAGAFLPAEASVFVNFDPSVFSERSIADAALREMRLVMREAGLKPARVVCEMTEQRLSSASSFLFFVEALKASGFRVAVDDFGAADSDIERVRAVGPAIVKFDAEWVTRLMGSGAGLLLLSALMERFASENVETVFEGIEERWQIDLAERVGATMVQGFALARPEIVPARFSAEPVPAAPAGTAPPEREVGAERPARAFGRRPGGA